MSMLRSRLALRLLAYGPSFGAREELLGDLQEEIAGGRPSWWVWQQLIGVYGFACATQLRDRARLTPLAVALALFIVMLAGISLASASRVLELWLGIYYVTGTVSLFAEMISRAFDARANIVGDAGDPSQPMYRPAQTPPR
jgi:Zn-dependent protease with chaperone function